MQKAGFDDLRSGRVLSFPVTAITALILPVMEIAAFYTVLYLAEKSVISSNFADVLYQVILAIVVLLKISFLWLLWIQTTSVLRWVVFAVVLTVNVIVFRGYTFPVLSNIVGRLSLW